MVPTGEQLAALKRREHCPSRALKFLVGVKKQDDRSANHNTHHGGVAGHASFGGRGLVRRHLLGILPVGDILIALGVSQHWPAPGSFYLENKGWQLQ
jgi:hypothetical protein